MTIAHESFSLERLIAASPARVFKTWADPALKRAWFVDSDGPDWQERDYALDFRVGGMETGRFVLASGPGAGEHRNVTHYLDIVPDERIVYAYTMAHDGRIHSASLATVALGAENGGTRLTYTEQGSYFGGSDGAQGRQHGWTHLLNALQSVAEKEPAA